MNSPLSAAEDFLSPRAKYERYNFHRPLDRERAREALRAPKPRIVTLEGLDEENHLLLVESACYQASREGDRWECVRLGFDDYNPDSGTAESFLNDQLSRREARGGKVERLREALSGLALGLKAELDISTAFAISVAVSGGLRFAELLEAAAPTFEPVRGYPAPGPERLRTLVNILTAESGVVLYLPGSYPLPITLRRWLINLSKHNDRLLLAFATVGAHGAGEMTMGAEVREHFRLAPLTLPELTEAVDERFRPNAFPSDFYDALLVQSKGIPWRLAEVMKRLMQAGALEGGGNGPWRLLTSSSMLSPFSSTFHEPVNRLLDSPDPWDQTTAKFIFLCALFPDAAPASLICKHLGVEPGEVDVFVDLVLDLFGPTSETPLLSETSARLNLSSDRALRFRSTISRALFLDSEGEDTLVHVTRELLVTCDEMFSVLTLESARLFYVLSHHLPEGERGLLRTELEWWVGVAEAEELTIAVCDDLRSGRVPPEVLVELLTRMFALWPPYRSRALLNALDRANVAVPFSCVPALYQAKAAILLEIGELEEAESVALQGLAFCQHKSPWHAGCFLGHLSAICGHKGDYRSALRYAERRLDSTKRLLEDYESLSAAWLACGQALFGLGELEEAEIAILKSIDAFERRHSDRLNMLGDAYFSAATLYSVRRNPRLAMQYAEKGLTVVTAAAGEGTNKSTSYALRTVGLVHASLGDSEAALCYLEAAISAAERVFGPADPEVAVTLDALGFAHLKLGNPDSAVVALDRARQIVELHSTSSSTLGGILLLRGCGLHLLGRADEARRDSRQAVKILLAAGTLSSREGVGGFAEILEVLCTNQQMEQAWTIGEDFLSAVRAQAGQYATEDLEQIIAVIEKACGRCASKSIPSSRDRTPRELTGPAVQPDLTAAPQVSDAVAPEAGLLRWLRNLWVTRRHDA